jgi:putative membrane protein
MTNRTSRYPILLLSLYLGWWCFLAISPWYREDWLLENVLVFVGLPVAILVHRRLSRGALTALFLFFVLHALGAHYTYEKVPYDLWSEAAFGTSISDLLGLHRNHFDRLVHLLYGLLVTPAFMQLLDANIVMRGGWRYLIPLTFMASQSALYEVIEWGAAVVFGGDLGQAYLGTQGDVWDAQKDSALALLGSLVSVICIRLYQRRRG